MSVIDSKFRFDPVAVFDAKNKEIASLRQQVTLMQKQVSADVAQILKLLDVIESARGPTGATEGIQEHAQHIEKVVLTWLMPKQEN